MKRIRIFLLLAFFAGAAGIGNAQEYAIYNQYHFHYYLMNPALAGAAECTHFMLSHKQQWVGIEDAPHTTTLSFQTRTPMRLGIGAYLYNDQNGYSYQQGGQVSLAYHIPMSPGNRYTKSPTLDRQLSFGVSAKFYRYDLASEVVDDANAHGENIQKKDGIYPNANFGVFYQSYKFFTGVSMTNLIPVKIDLFSDDEPIRPFTLMGQIGYGFEAGRDIVVEPSAVFKYDQDSRTQLDLGLRVMQNVTDRDVSWWAGVIYKQNLDNGEYQPLVLVPNFTIVLGKLRFGYAANLDLNALAGHNYGSHELMIGYSLCHTKKFCR